MGQALTFKKAFGTNKVPKLGILFFKKFAILGNAKLIHPFIFLPYDPLVFSAPIQNLIQPFIPFLRETISASICALIIGR